MASLPASKVSAEEEGKVMMLMEGGLKFMKEGGMKVDLKEPVRHHLSLGHVGDIWEKLRTRLRLLPTGCWFSCLEGKGGE